MPTIHYAVYTSYLSRDHLGKLLVDGYDTDGLQPQDTPRNRAAVHALKSVQRDVTTMRHELASVVQAAIADKQLPVNSTFKLTLGHIEHNDTERHATSLLIDAAIEAEFAVLEVIMARSVESDLTQEEIEEQLGLMGDPRFADIAKAARQAQAKELRKQAAALEEQAAELLKQADEADGPSM